MIKALVGYTLVEGVTPEEYDRWLWDIHTPDLLANPHLDRIVYNTILKPIKNTNKIANATNISVPFVTHLS